MMWLPGITPPYSSDSAAPTRGFVPPAFYLSAVPNCVVIVNQMERCRCATCNSEPLPPPYDELPACVVPAHEESHSSCLEAAPCDRPWSSVCVAVQCEESSQEVSVLDQESDRASTPRITAEALCDRGCPIAAAPHSTSHSDAGDSDVVGATRGPTPPQTKQKAKRNTNEWRVAGRSGVSVCAKPPATQNRVTCSSVCDRGGDEQPHNDDDEWLAPRQPKKRKKSKRVKDQDLEDERLLKSLMTDKRKSASGHGRFTASRIVALVDDTRVRDGLTRVAKLGSPTSQLLVLRDLDGQARRAGDLATAVVLRQTAEAQCELFDVDSAKSSASGAVAISKRLGIDLLEIAALLTLGRALHLLVQAEEALQPLLRCKLLAEKSGEAHAHCLALSLIATTHELLGQYGEALECYAEAEEMVVEIGDKKLQCEIGANHAVALLSLGFVAEARQRLLPLLSRAKDCRATSVVAKTLSNLGYTAVISGDLAGAVAYHEEEVRVAKEAGDVVALSQAYENCGSAHRLARNMKLALRSFKEELEVVADADFPSRQCECHSNLGATYREVQQLEKAKATHLKELQVARKAGDVVLEAKALVSIADVAALADGAASALPKYVRALQLIDDGIPREDKAKYMVKVGCCEVEWRAFDGLEKRFCEIGSMAEAMHAADQKHLPLLTDLLGSSPYQQLSRYLSSTQFDLGRIAHVLPSVKAVILYSTLWDDVTDLHGYVCFPSTGAVHHVKLNFTGMCMCALYAQQSPLRQLQTAGRIDMPLVPQLLAQLGEVHYQQELSSTGPPTVQDCMDALYACLLEPLEAVLRQGNTLEDDTVCFVPDGLLGNVPFHCLRCDDGRFVAEKYCVTTVPSISLLEHLVERQTTKVLSPSDEVTIITTQAAQWSFVEASTTVDVSGVGADGRKQLVVDKVAGAQGTLILDLPCGDDMREEFSGSLEFAEPPMSSVFPPVRVSTANDQRIRSEEILKWGEDTLRQVSAVIVTGHARYTPRVIHETSVATHHALFGAGANRVLSTLWLLDSSSKQHASFLQRITRRPDGDYAQHHRRCMLESIAAGNDWQVWGRFALSGLP